MIKKTMTYNDFNGKSRTEDFYFNLSKSEFIELEVSTGAKGLAGLIEKLQQEENNGEIFKIFKRIIEMSYGEKSDDGARFEKSQERLDRFKSKQAYDDLLVELFTNEGSLVQWITGLLPADVAAEAGLKENMTMEDARRLSEAKLQGHKKKEPAAKTEREQELPTVDERVQAPNDAGEKLVGTNGETIITATADPVFEEETPLAQPATPSAPIDVAGFSAEQKLELFKAGKITAEQLR